MRYDNKKHGNEIVAVSACFKSDSIWVVLGSWDVVPEQCHVILEAVTC